MRVIVREFDIEGVEKTFVGIDATPKTTHLLRGYLAARIRSLVDSKRIDAEMKNGFDMDLDQDEVNAILEKVGN